MVSLPETTPPAVQPGNAETEDQQQQQQHLYNPLPPEAYVNCLTPEAKEKGDAGIYAALDAMQLSRALHGVTNSRLEPLSASGTSAVVAAGGGVAGARANGSKSNTNNGGTASGAVQLGMEPAAFRHGAAAEVRAIFSAAVVEAVEAASGGRADAPAVTDAVRRGMEGASGGAASTAVGVPEAVEALEQVIPLVHEVKPHDRLSYDALQRLFQLMETAATMTESEEDGEAEAARVGVATLLLSHGVMDPSQQPAPSAAAWEAMYHDVQARYPLPVPQSATSANGDDAEDEEEEEEDEDEDGEGSAAAKKHNAALQERCAALQIPYTSYSQAARDVASYEMRVFPLLCLYLRPNEASHAQASKRRSSSTSDNNTEISAEAVRHRACVNVKVLDLSHNNIGAAAADKNGGAPTRSLAPLRALAAMIDANESLRYLNLRANVLGPKGTGILAKALTKNIALAGIDLSANGLGGGGGANAAAVEAAEAEEVEDPLHEEEDPVFGETYEGLEALAEVLKKNKFLRVLRLAENGLHAGEELAGAPPPEDEPEEDSGDAAARNNGGGMSIADAQERWQTVPLWTLLSPLCRYHRLRVLDLSKNYLGNTGAQMVAVALSHNRSIEVLDLTDNAIGYAGLNYLARYVLNSPLSNAAAGAAYISSSPYQQRQRPSPLHTLILRQNPLAAVGGAADAATGVDTQRRRLTKRQQKQATNAMHTFAEALQRHGGLRRLIVSNAYLGPAASATLLRALAQMPALEELDFSFNNACGDHVATYDPAAVPHIAALLYPPPASPSESPPSQLRRLCLDGNNLTPAGLSALQPADPATSVLRSLRELTLSRNGLGDALDSLCPLITRGVTRLDLSYNDITTLIGLLPALSVAASPLEELNLSHNKLGVQEGLLRELPTARQEEEVTQAFQCLARMPHLAVLDLSYNDWKSAHVEQLGAVFADPALATQLRKLDVRHTPLVPAAPLMALLESVASRPAMEVFLASIPVEKAESADEAQADPVDAAAEEMQQAPPQQRWTYDAILDVIHRVVSVSDSLLEVDCGLRAGDAAGSASTAADVPDAEAAAAAAEEAMAARVAQIRERLLLNALVAASRRPAAEMEAMEA